jgi:hypothetical protein
MREYKQLPPPPSLPRGDWGGEECSNLGGGSGGVGRVLFSILQKKPATIVLCPFHTLDKSSIIIYYLLENPTKSNVWHMPPYIYILELSLSLTEKMSKGQSYFTILS